MPLRDHPLCARCRSDSKGEEWTAKVPASQAPSKIRAHTDWNLQGEELDRGSRTLEEALKDRPTVWGISLPMHPRVFSVEG